MRRARTVPVTLVRVALTLALAVGSAAPLSAQDDPSSIVVIETKSAFAAGALEFFLPTVGYAYAGNWTRGIPTGIVRLVAGFVMIQDEIDEIAGCFDITERCESQGDCDDACAVALGVGLAATIFAVVDASKEAGRFNARQVAGRPPGGPLLGLDPRDGRATLGYRLALGGR